MSRKIPTKFGRYKLLNAVCRSQYSVIVSAIDPMTREKVIAKVIDMEIIPRQEVEIETSIMDRINHRYVMKLIRAVDDSGYRAIIMRTANMGDLEMAVREKALNSLGMCARIMYRIVLGIRYLHNKKILHGDIKPANVLLFRVTKEDIKPAITDFGLSTLLNESSICKCNRGTCSFSAPELLNRKPHSYPSDIWSLGATFYYMMTGSTVYPHIPFESLRTIVYTKRPMYQGGLFENAPIALINLIDSMMSTDPNDRPSIHGCLESQFFDTMLDKEFLEKEKIEEMMSPNINGNDILTETKYHV